MHYYYYYFSVIVEVNVTKIYVPCIPKQHYAQLVYVGRSADLPHNYSILPSLRVDSRVMQSDLQIRIVLCQTVAREAWTWTASVEKEPLEDVKKQPVLHQMLL